MNDKLPVNPWQASTTEGDSGISARLQKEEPPRPDPDKDLDVSRPITTYDPAEMKAEPGWVKEPPRRLTETEKYLNTLKDALTGEDAELQ